MHIPKPSARNGITRPLARQLAPIVQVLNRGHVLDTEHVLSERLADGRVRLTIPFLRDRLSAAAGGTGGTGGGGGGGGGGTPVPVLIASGYSPPLNPGDSVSFAGTAGAFHLSSLSLRLAGGDGHLDFRVNGSTTALAGLAVSSAGGDTRYTTPVAVPGAAALALFVVDMELPPTKVYYNLYGLMD